MGRFTARHDYVVAFTPVLRWGYELRSLRYEFNKYDAQFTAVGGSVFTADRLLSLDAELWFNDKIDTVQLIVAFQILFPLDDDFILFLR